MFRDLFETVNAYLARDPAARGPLEVLLLYPGVKAISYHRKAHWCYEHDLKFLCKLVKCSAYLMGSVCAANLQLVSIHLSIYDFSSRFCEDAII